MREINHFFRGGFYQRILLSAAICFGGQSWAETLGDVLRPLNLPSPSANIADVSQPIISYAVMEQPAEFVIAYYRDTGSKQLEPPLIVLRYSKPANLWTKGQLTEVAATINGIKVDCFGSGLQISRAGRYLLIDTHLNPSAGCLLVLKDNLKLKKALYGWFLGAFKDGTSLFHNSEVHFAPTHPMEISLYDPARNSTVLIYPPVHDEQRTQFIRALDKAAPDENWCREANSHCDIKQFGSELVDGPAVNDRTHSFAFVSRYYAEGYGPKVDYLVGTRDVVYVYRLLSSGIIHREFSFEEAEHLFGTASPQELVTPAMLSRIFAKTAAKPN